jgi:hypothetical protein
MINEKREEVCANLAHTTRNATVEGENRKTRYKP